MKSITSVFGLLGLVAISIVFSSFSGKWGGEGFEIFLDNKVVMQRFGKEINTVQSLQLDQQNVNSQLTIKYHHCGKAGKNRVVVIKDAKGNLLKEWKFADVKDPYASMSCSVKEILSLQKGSRAITVSLYYSSSELPNGRQLASVVLPPKNLTTP